MWIIKGGDTAFNLSNAFCIDIVPHCLTDNLIIKGTFYRDDTVIEDFIISAVDKADAEKELARIVAELEKENSKRGFKNKSWEIDRTAAVNRSERSGNYKMLVQPFYYLDTVDKYLKIMYWQVMATQLDGTNTIIQTFDNRDDAERYLKNLVDELNGDDLND